ncbi:chemotaxis protein CheW [Magnetococcales bacterium HHB-1]
MPSATKKSRLPSQSEAQRILMERAEKFSTPKQSTNKQDQGELFVKIKLGNSTLFGIPYRFTEEILFVKDLISVPGTETFIMGILNRRGELLTVINLKSFFNIQEPPETPHKKNEENRIVAVCAAGMTIGILTDSVEGNDRYYASRLAPSLEHYTKNGDHFVEGIHDEQVAILNMEKLLNHIALLSKK